MTGTPLVIRRIVTHPVRIPYTREIRWAGHAETCADYMLIEITTEDGLTGVGEGTVKTNWTGATLRSLSVSIEEIFAPRLLGVDATDEGAIGKILDRIPEHRLAKSMIDVACWDLRAQAAGRPLWQLWGGEPNVPMSWTITRQKPADMAREAADKVASHGFGTLKIKTGQEPTLDFAALDQIRAAVGDGVRLYADCNGAYPAAAATDYTAGLKAHGVFLAEDPCRFRPDASFERLRASCALPLLVDHECRSATEAALFLERGAEGLSVKIGKSGLTESWSIARMAQERSAKTVVGFFAESSLGALAALQLAAALPARGWLPAETSFFLSLPQEFVHMPLTIRNGAVTLPDRPGFGSIVDWDRVKALRP